MQGTYFIPSFTAERAGRVSLVRRVVFRRGLVSLQDDGEVVSGVPSFAVLGDHRADAYSLTVVWGYPMDLKYTSIT